MVSLNGVRDPCFVTRSCSACHSAFGFGTRNSISTSLSTYALWKSRCRVEYLLALKRTGLMVLMRIGGTLAALDFLRRMRNIDLYSEKYRRSTVAPAENNPASRAWETWLSKSLLNSSEVSSSPKSIKTLSLRPSISARICRGTLRSIPQTLQRLCHWLQGRLWTSLARCRGCW